MATKFYGSLCITDIDKSLIRTGKNGKEYLSICINEKKEADQYGNTHYIKSYNPNKDAKANFIGDLKLSQFQSTATADADVPTQSAPTPSAPAPTPTDAPADIEADSDLPF